MSGGLTTQALGFEEGSNSSVDVRQHEHLLRGSYRNYGSPKEPPWGGTTVVLVKIVTRGVNVGPKKGAKRIFYASVTTSGPVP